MVECSPATRAARVRFPDDAVSFDHTDKPNKLNTTMKNSVLYCTRCTYHVYIVCFIIARMRAIAKNVCRLCALYWLHYVPY